MSYTLRGRIESRLAGGLLPVLGAAIAVVAIGKWWPVVLAGLMVGAGLVLDLGAYHRLLAYQPGWAALPLGLLELAATMGLALALDVGAPLRPALLLFGGSWLAGQVLGHAVFPLVRHTYGEDGGELGRLGAVAAAAALTLLAFSGGVAWGTRPPTVHLAAGVHGPLVLDSAQTVVGEPGAVVRGGIRITADHVIVRNVEVVAGEYGVVVQGAEHVLLDGVRIRGASLDGIHARRSQVTIRDCDIGESRGAYGQGIDISFSIDLPPSTVEGCTIRGGLEGIVTHSANVMVEDNHVLGTALRAITVTEMSMGTVEGNRVDDALGVGIFCGDYSECMIERNAVSGTRPDLASGDRTRLGFGIVAHYRAKAEIRENQLLDNPRRMGSFVGASIHAGG